HTLSRSQLLHDLHEILVAIVDRALGAQREACLALFGCARGGKYAAAECPCQLDCGHANAAAAALHQKCFARRQTTALEDVDPHRKACLRQSCCLDCVPTTRDREAMARRGDAKL